MFLLPQKEALEFPCQIDPKDERRSIRGKLQPPSWGFFNSRHAEIWCMTGLGWCVFREWLLGWFVFQGVLWNGFIFFENSSFFQGVIPMSDSVDGSFEIRRSPVEVGSLSLYYQGFIHRRWLAGFLPSDVPMIVGSDSNEWWDPGWFLDRECFGMGLFFLKIPAFFPGFDWLPMWCFISAFD